MVCRISSWALIHSSQSAMMGRMERTAQKAAVPTVADHTERVASSMDPVHLDVMLGIKEIFATRVS